MSIGCHGKVVVITGASGGIGQALIHEFLDAGALVIGTDLNGAPLQQLVEDREKYGQDFFAMELDVTKPDHIDKALTQIVTQHGKIDVWINAAGLAENRAFLEFSDQDYDRIVNVNLLGVIHCCRKVLRLMEGQAHGTIINLASVAGHIAPPFMSPYTTAKHALVGFTKSLQAELDFLDSPVRVMLVSPGFVATPMIATGQEMGFPEWLRFMLAEPRQVAQAIIKAYKSGQNEITPTWNGKLMLGLHRWLPKTTVKSSRILLTKSWKDLFLNRYHIR